MMIDHSGFPSSRRQPNESASLVTVDVGSRGGGEERRMNDGASWLGGPRTADQHVHK